ncbi:MAG TPA: hypothetical protein VJZ01_02330, partial [Lachnospiraceae bacterium]|nr:hypothetical protein [Lachnospiraceae bacterium]
KKIINIILWICMISFIVLLLGIVFFIACFALLEGEINIDEAMLTCAFAMIAVLLVMFRFGLPLLGIGITGLMLNNGKGKEKPVKAILIACIIWLVWGIAVVAYNMIVW